MKLYRIKKSNIDENGKGLYAATDIKEGTKIIEYIGNIITKKKVMEILNLIMKNRSIFLI